MCVCVCVCGNWQWHLSAAGKLQLWSITRQKKKKKTLTNHSHLLPRSLQLLTISCHPPKLLWLVSNSPFHWSFQLQPLCVCVCVCVCVSAHSAGDRTVHLPALTMFLQGAEADVEVFGLFFRSELQHDWKIPQNRTLIERRIESEVVGGCATVVVVMGVQTEVHDLYSLSINVP